MAAPVQAGMPSSLDVGPTYTLRLAAIDPATGNTVANVKVGAVVITATADSAASSGGTDELAVGDWYLVPGPLA